MRYGFLLVMAGATLIMGACGGRVVFDGNNMGSGGNGGLGGQGGSVNHVSTNSTTGVLVGPGPSVTTDVSVGVGPSCTCGAFCANFAACGGPPGQCMKTCGQLPQGVIDCGCMAGPNCMAIKSCFANGVGPGPTTTVGAGGGPSQACSDCVNSAAQGGCQPTLQDCSNDPACVQVLDCHQNCGWDPACKQMCDMGGSVSTFQNLLVCVLCKSCDMACAGSEIFNEYCTFPP